MRRRDSICSLLALVVSTAAGGCGSSIQPIPDPGGPFHTNVPANKSLGSLTMDETSELCSELISADQAFLITAYATQVTCLTNGYAAASLVDAGTGPLDGGADSADAGNVYQRACQTAYDSCIADLARDQSLFACPLPAQSCGASVEILSACLNEIAAADPISLCTGTVGCAAAGPVQVNLPTPPQSSTLPPTPGCTRLTQECPTVYFNYPCAE